MINHQVKSRLLQVLVLTAVIGFNPLALAQVENYTVQMRLNGNQTELDVESKGRCSKNNHKGCIEVPHKKKAKVNFSFVGKKQCNRPAGVSWEVGEVYLGGKDKSDKPGSSGWGNLDADVKADFNVADAVSGRLNKEAGSNKNSIVISDENILPYEIWYKVTAVCVDGSGKIIDTIETDPRIKNGGSL
jgi:hypothetical protein